MCVSVVIGESSGPVSRRLALPISLKFDLSCVLFILSPRAASCLPRLPPPAPLMRLLLLGSVSYPPPSPRILLRLLPSSVSSESSFPPPSPSCHGVHPTIVPASSTPAAAPLLVTLRPRPGLLRPPLPLPPPDPVGLGRRVRRDVPLGEHQVQVPFKAGRRKKVCVSHFFML